MLEPYSWGRLIRKSLYVIYPPALVLGLITGEWLLCLLLATVLHLCWLYYYQKKLADWPIDLTGASLLSILLIAVALLAWWLQKRLTGNTEVTSVTGKPGENSGAALGWLLLTTLWLPLLDYARSYAPQASQLASALGPEPGCVQMVGLSRAQVAALQQAKIKMGKIAVFILGRISHPVYAFIMGCIFNPF